MLKLLLSNWLVWGCILSLVVGMIVMVIFRRPAPVDTTKPEPLSWIDQDALLEEWTSQRPAYAEIRGKLQDDRIWLGDPLARGEF